MKRTYGVLLAVVAAAAGCENGSPGEPEVLPPLEAGVWYVHSASGQPVPAMVAGGQYGDHLQQTFLDSASLRVLPDRRWELRADLQLLVGGFFQGTSTRQDAGSWAPTDSGYVFTSDVAGPLFSIRDPRPDSLKLVLSVDGIAGTIDVVLRRHAPPVPLSGRWRVTHLEGEPLPRRLYHFDPDFVDGRWVSIHIIADSARLTLTPAGTYAHVIWVSEWEGVLGGPPEVRKFQHVHGDHGVWSREGNAVLLQSNWFVNHNMTGDVQGGALLVQHGFGYGEPSAGFRYGR